ncbi:hypothetical protein B0H10DRAFT_2193624 [Mycena sp. CBHHK59/15]|nr:hypothetical protein B0H10DRAFT_2193624 [Mycena sp. CBHHK59/15]
MGVSWWFQSTFDVILTFFQRRIFFKKKAAGRHTHTPPAMQRLPPSGPVPGRRGEAALRPRDLDSTFCIPATHALDPSTAQKKKAAGRHIHGQLATSSVIGLCVREVRQSRADHSQFKFDFWRSRERCHQHGAAKPCRPLSIQIRFLVFPRTMPSARASALEL